MRRLIVSLSTLFLLGGAAFAQATETAYNLTPCNSLSGCEQKYNEANFAFTNADESMRNLQGPTDAELQDAIIQMRDAQIATSVYSNAYSAYYNYENEGLPLEDYYPSFDPEVISDQYSENLSFGLTELAYYQHRYSEDMDPETFYAAVQAMAANVMAESYAANYQAANTPPPTGGGSTTPTDPGTGSGSGGTANPPATALTSLKEITDKFSASDITIGILAVGATLAVIYAAIHAARTVLRLMGGTGVQHSAEDLAEYQRRTAEMAQDHLRISKQIDAYERKNRGFRTLRNRSGG